MNVKELIEELNKYAGDAPVYIFDDNNETVSEVIDIRILIHTYGIVLLS